MQRLFILTIISAMLFISGCSSNAEAVAAANKLSKQELSKLYDDMSALNSTRKNYRDIYFDTHSGFPEEFKSLNPQEIVVSFAGSRIILSGQFDDKVFLLFNGLDGKSKKSIVLFPGEAKDSKVLWSSK